MPTVTEQLALLTQSVDALTAAVNVKKVTLDNSVATAQSYANTAVVAVASLQQIIRVEVLNSANSIPVPAANNTIYLVRA